MTGLAAAGAVTNYMGQRSAAKQQEAAQAQATAQERERAARESTSIRLRQGQQRDALAQEIEEGSRRANQARATAAVSSGEAGVGGRAAELVAQDINAQHARYNHSLVKQRAENDFNSELQAEDARMRSEQNLVRINQPIEQPNPLSIVTDLVGGVANASMQEARYKQATGRDMTLGSLIGLNIGGTGQAESQVAPEPMAMDTQPYSTSSPYQLPDFNQSAPASNQLLS